MNKRKSYEKIPQALFGKCFAFTGTLPGVGKTYFRKWLTKQIKKDGFKVITSGYTHKATDEDGQTTAALLKNRKNRASIHTQTYGFVMKDEAFMMSQQELEELKRRYPKCCFLLFGDPLQFDPPTKNAIPLSNKDFDYVWSFDTPHRQTDYKLIKFIENVKNGNFDRIQKESQNLICKNWSASQIHVTYQKKIHEELNKKFENNVEIGRICKSSRTFSYDEDGNLNKIHNYNEVMNNELWKITNINGSLISLSSLNRNKELKIFKDSIEWTHFTCITNVNAHNIQGDTYDENQEIVIWPDSNFNNQKTIYVAASRARKMNQIRFAFELNPNQKDVWKPLVNKVKSDWVGNNEELMSNFSGPRCHYINIMTSLAKKDTSFGLGLNEESPIVPNILNPYKIVLNDSLAEPSQGYAKKLLHELRKSIDFQLSLLHTASLPGKQGLFVSKNSTVSHKNEDVTDFSNFVFEFDDMSIADQQKLITKNRKLIYRSIFSGNKSYHIWIRVKNAPSNADDYRKMAKLINEHVFEGEACQSCVSPAGLMRAPTETQPIHTNKRNIVIFNEDFLIEEVTTVSAEEPVTTAFDNSVEYYFNLCRNDHDGKNGGRGELMLAKTFKQQREHNWNNGQCRELIRLLGTEWNCQDKISRLQSYFN